MTREPDPETFDPEPFEEYHLQFDEEDFFSELELLFLLSELFGNEVDLVDGDVSDLLLVLLSVT